MLDNISSARQFSLNVDRSSFVIYGRQGYRGIHYATYQSAIHGFANAHELGPLRKQLFGKRLPRSSHKLPSR